MINITIAKIENAYVRGRRSVEVKANIGIIRGDVLQGMDHSGFEAGSFSFTDPAVLDKIEMLVIKLITEMLDLSAVGMDNADGSSMIVGIAPTVTRPAANDQFII